MHNIKSEEKKIQYNSILWMDRRPLKVKQKQKEISKQVKDGVNTIFEKMKHAKCKGHDKSRPSMRNKLVFNQMKENYVRDLKKVALHQMNSIRGTKSRVSNSKRGAEKRVQIMKSQLNQAHHNSMNSMNLRSNQALLKKLPTLRRHTQFEEVKVHEPVAPISPVLKKMYSENEPSSLAKFASVENDSESSPKNTNQSPQKEQSDGSPRSRN